MIWIQRKCSTACVFRSMQKGHICFITLPVSERRSAPIQRKRAAAGGLFRRTAFWGTRAGGTLTVDRLLQTPDPWSRRSPSGDPPLLPFVLLPIPAFPIDSPAGLLPLGTVGSARGIGSLTGACPRTSFFPKVAPLFKEKLSGDGTCRST